MADKKISALTSATTPLAGTEVLPIVQSSATVKVAVSDLTAGRTFSALGMTLTSTDAGATAAPLIDLYRDSATPAASDTLGEIEFNGEDSAGNKQTYGVIHASILSPTSTAEEGQLHFETATAGALTEKMIIGTTNLVINEIGAVYNVRIEGDTDANLFYTDATNSRVGIGTSSPTTKLQVAGVVTATAYGGHIVQSSVTSNVSGSTSANTYTDTGASLSLSAGTWLINTSAAVALAGQTGITVAFRYPVLALTDSSNNIQSEAICSGGSFTDSIGTGAMCFILTVASTTTYKTRFASQNNSGSPTITGATMYATATRPHYLVAQKLT
jgi:hypothetical protein